MLGAQFLAQFYTITHYMMSCDWKSMSVGHVGYSLTNNNSSYDQL